MKFIICIDRNNGMLFNNRRQSSDLAVIDRIIKLIDNKKLYMNHYSAELFNGNENIIVNDGFFSLAGEDDYCFIESSVSNIADANEIILINWNRNYPYDVSFDIDLISNGFKKVSSENFKGHSHKKITMIKYRRN